MKGSMFLPIAFLLCRCVAATKDSPFLKGPAPLSFVGSSRALEIRGGEIPGKSAYDWYLGQCTDRPLATKSVTAAFVTALGDIISQKVESLQKGVDLLLNRKRVISFFLCGLLFVGPFLNIWQNQLWGLQRWMKAKYDSSKNLQVLAALFVDQTLGVIIYFPAYFYAFEYMEALVYMRRPSLSRAHTKCMEQISKVFLMQYRLFPISNWISFALVPEPLRILYANIVSIFWNIFLCTLVAE